MNHLAFLRYARLSAWRGTFQIGLALLGFAIALQAADQGPASRWNLPEAAEVTLSGAWGEAYDRGVKRLELPPYDSPVYLRSDFSFETNRIFVNYSGDISGRFIQIASLVSPSGEVRPPTLAAVLRDFMK